MVNNYPLPPNTHTPTSLQILREVKAGDVVLTQVVLSHSGRMLFVGTSSGAVRSVKFPLSDTGEWQEHQAHAASVSRVRGEGGREGGM